MDFFTYKSGWSTPSFFETHVCVFSFVTKREPEKSRLAAAGAVAQAGSTILLGDGTGDNPQVPPDPTLTPPGVETRPSLAATSTWAATVWATDS